MCYLNIRTSQIWELAHTILLLKSLHNLGWEVISNGCIKINLEEPTWRRCQHSIEQKNVLINFIINIILFYFIFFELLKAFTFNSRLF